MNHPLMLERHLHYYKRLKALREAQDSKVESVHLRKSWLDTQKRTNYQNEYDRLRNSISHTTSRSSRSYIEDRMKQLVKLGAMAIDGIQ